MKLLFLSRAYPPIIGGLENHNYELHKALEKKISINAILNKKGKKALPFFIPFCTLKTLYDSSSYDAILLGDGVLAIVGWFVKFFQPSIPIICITHGLDITYSNRIYQLFWIKIFLSRLDIIISVSQATAKAAAIRGIKKEKLNVIPNGINTEQNKDNIIKKELDNIIPVFYQDKTILLTIGRLVKRKGVEWFVRHVMPQLSEQFIYIIAGDGPEKENINLAINENYLENRVFNLGFVNDEIKTVLFSSANLFIQPNIKVKGDMEGFGIAVLEANLQGLPVIGAKLEGLEDSIISGKNGWSIESKNPTKFIKKIEEVTESPQILEQAGLNAKAFCLKNFSWDNIANQYIDILLKSIK